MQLGKPQGVGDGGVVVSPLACNWSMLSGHLRQPMPGFAITRDAERMRFKEFRDAATSSQPVNLEDWPMSGPRMVKHVITATGKSALAHHQSWRTACRFQPTHRPGDGVECCMSWQHTIN